MRGEGREENGTGNKEGSGKGTKKKSGEGRMRREGEEGGGKAKGQRKRGRLGRDSI